MRSLVRRSAADRELARELRFHLDERVKELVDEGVAPAEAWSAAEREFGSTASIEQQCRETRRVGFFTNLVQDLRYACRMVVREPILTLAAATSIALGVGANLTIFGLGNTLLLSKPTAARPDQLVNVRTAGGSHASYRVWRALNDSGAMEGIAGQRVELEVNWRGAERSVTITPQVVTANYFDLLRVPMLIGRGFTAAEADAERNPRLAVLGYRFWNAQLAADPGVLGRTITLNGEPFEVLGVLPPETRSPAGLGMVPDVYLPITRALVPDLDSVISGHVQLVGRLREGQSMIQARTALASAADDAARTLGAERDRSIRQFSSVGQIDQSSEFRPIAFFFLALLVVTILVLTIACANVAGLLLARGIARRREIAIRLAVGASRARLVQQLLTEGLVLSAIGVGGGLLLTAGAGSLFSTISLPLPWPIEFHVDFTGRLLWLAAGLVVLSALLSALTPALGATRGRLTPALKQETVSYVHRRFTLRAIIVTSQVAISLVLLVVTLLFIRNLDMARTLEPGFAADRLVAADVTFVEGRQGSPGEPAIRAVVEGLRAMPGVEAAAFAAGLPLNPSGMNWTGTRMRIEGIDAPVRVEYASNEVGPGYFDAMGIRLLYGRDFSPADRTGAPLVIVINREFVRRYFGDLSPIGRHIDIERARDTVPAEVIGVVADSKYRTIGEQQAPAVYGAYLQRGSARRRVFVAVRTSGQPADAERALRAAIQQMDGSAAVNVQAMGTALEFAFLPSRLGAALMGSLGVLGAVLAMVGLYGVVAFNVSRRTAEIAVRVAMGATRGAVLRLVLKDCAWLAGSGMVCGVALAAAATPLLSSFLVADLSASDPLSFFAAMALLGLTSLAAAWRPARRASRVDPAAALRSE